MLQCILDIILLNLRSGLYSSFVNLLVHTVTDSIKICSINSLTKVCINTNSLGLCPPYAVPDDTFFHQFDILLSY